MRVLLVANDARLAGVLRSSLGLSGATVEWIFCGAEAEPALHSGEYDCVVLELGLPDIAGEEVLRRIRQSGFEQPLVVITSDDEVQDRIRLLDMGADDFLVKPVHLGELAARLRALLRRCDRQPMGDTELRFGRLRVMPASRVVSHDGAYVPLTHKEFSLLETLLRARGQVVSREALEDALHGESHELCSNPIEVHVHHLRRKLGAHLIRTVRGIGYTLGLET